ncbi:MAG: RecX family transcriptional regulator [Coriobacteriales bacterium]|jgi:regulatory protein|nr:RecX family transcriptional regulator [Coriobacteriales bacterium]
MLSRPVHEQLPRGQVVCEGASSRKKTKKDLLTDDMRLFEVRKRMECLINTRERTETELRDRLIRAGFDEKLVEGEVKRAVAAGLVDDERFTQLFIAEKKRSGWGCIRVERELRRYGIDIKRREDYPQEFFDEKDELKRALDCLEHFHSRAKNQKAAQFRRLLTRGFSMATTQKALGYFSE